jgi:DNA-directed RNA polymerase subunit N (RpoN/RPB10)
MPDSTLIPPRCTCGALVSRKHQQMNRLLASGGFYTTETALMAVGGGMKYCCNRFALTRVPLETDLAQERILREGGQKKQCENTHTPHNMHSL